MASGTWTSPRTATLCAVTAAALLAAGGVLVLTGQMYAAAVSGVLCHLALLPVVAASGTHEAARAAGYAWQALDITAAAMTIADPAHSATAMSVRLGGHVLGAVWVVAVAHRAGSHLRGTTRVLGYVVGPWLGLFTLVSNVVPEDVVLLLMPLMVAWLTVVGLYLARGVSLTSAASTERTRDVHQR